MGLLVEELTMSRNALVRESLRPAPAGPSVWSMAMTVLGAAFGATRLHPVRMLSEPANGRKADAR